MSSEMLAPVFRIDSETGLSVPYDFGDVAKIASDELNLMHQEVLSVGESLFVSRLHQGTEVDRQTGLTRTWLPGSKERPVSDDEFFVLLGGFGVTHNEMVRIAEYLRRVGSALGVRDQQGREVGVLLIDPTSRQAEKNLSKEGLAAVRRGELQPWGELLHQTVDNWMDKKRMQDARMGIIGYSLGSTLAPAMAEAAARANARGEKRFLDIASLILGALTNPIPGAHSSLQYVQKATKESQRGAYVDGTPEFFTSAQTTPLEIAKVVAAAPRLNGAIPSVMVYNKVLGSVLASMRAFPDMEVSFGIGSEDSMGTKRLMLTGIMSLHQASGRPLNVLLAEGKSHCWARDLRLLGAIAGTGMAGVNQA